MHVIASTRDRGRAVPYGRIAGGLLVGTVFLGVAATVAYLTFATPFLMTVSTTGPLTLSRVLLGVVSWTLALTAPVGFGLFGNIVVGILGAVLGGWLFGAVGFSFFPGIINTIITAFIGAVILLLVLRVIKRA